MIINVKNIPVNAVIIPKLHYHANENLEKNYTAAGVYLTGNTYKYFIPYVFIFLCCPICPTCLGNNIIYLIFYLSNSINLILSNSHIYYLEFMKSVLKHFKCIFFYKY